MQLMKRASRILLCFLGGSIALLILLWITISHWAPVVASHYLPKPFKLSFSEPRISHGQLDIANISITANNCTLVQLNSTRLSIFPLHAIVDDLDVKTECLSALEPTNEMDNEPINIAELIDNIPVFSLVINNTNIQPWSDYQGSIWLRKNQVNPLEFDFRGDNLRLSSLINTEHQLVIQNFLAFLP
ncbi:intermembrane phospholipid transport protein YdbH family protein [Providencia hangzhouensis]